MSDQMSKQLPDPKEAISATAELKERVRRMPPNSDFGLQGIGVDVLAALSIAESLDSISNDLAAIANMMADEAQEREAEQNRQEWVRPGASDRTP